MLLVNLLSQFDNFKDIFYQIRKKTGKPQATHESVLLLLTSFLRHAAKGFRVGFVGCATEKKKRGDNCEADT